MKQQAAHQFAIHYEKRNVIWDLSEHFLKTIPFHNPHVTFCCIGTDRSTGDCLGPIIGSYLQESFNFPFAIIGTLQQPLHALNLQEIMADLEKSTPFIIAIDACLSAEQCVGLIVVHEGPIYPGKAVKKQLPPIGNVAIKGVVNVGGFMEANILQNTRLFVTQSMAFTIAKALLLAWQRHLLDVKHHSNNYGDNDNTWQQIGYTNFC